MTTGLEGFQRNLMQGKCGDIVKQLEQSVTKEIADRAGYDYFYIIFL